VSTKTHVTIRSSNRKTGPIATTTREQTSCPTTCPLFSAGCYARGRIFSIATRLGSEDHSKILELITEIPQGGGLRLNVSGDFVLKDGSPDVDYIAACNRVATARPDVKIIAYTHAWRTLTPDLFTFGVNASCESETDVREARAAGWGTVTINAESDKIAGTRVVRCPAETRDDVSCATCMLCAKTPKINTTVTFTAHGSGKAKATAAVAAARS
jgi:hypothetical protein